MANILFGEIFRYDRRLEEGDAMKKRDIAVTICRLSG